MELLKTAIRLLEADGQLPMSYHPHKLSGQYGGCWECHLKPDWLLIWEQNDTELTLLFTGTGTHSDLCTTWRGNNKNKIRRTDYVTDDYRCKVFG